IANVLRTAEAPTTYSVEVATDGAFANKVFTKAGISEGANGTTTVTLGNLPGNVTYSWRWKATVDGVDTQYSAVQTFTVAQQIIVNAPSNVAPANGLSMKIFRPTFTARNATRQ